VVHNMVMIKANIFEVKARLSEYLDLATRGERIVICRHNKPVAELRAVEDVRTEPRPIGPLPGRPTFAIPTSFFEPLPAEELDLWDGIASTDPLSRERTSQAGGASRVAETKAEYTVRRGRRPAQRAGGRSRRGKS
jgi:antitoxin (DNA-binding transcriptional repressor) of toxin-antitoxin stability system